jgi:hypothetical protein
MKTISLPKGLLEAASFNNPDPLARYAALAALWRINPADVGCADLLTPGGKNSIAKPATVAEWDQMFALRDQWLAQMNIPTKNS